MTDKTAIANICFFEIAQGRTDDIAVDSGEAIDEFNDIYDEIRDLVLAEFVPNFASVTLGLVGVSLTVPEFNYARAYLRPDGTGSQPNLLRIMQLGSDRHPSTFEVEQDLILTDNGGTQANSLLAPDDFTDSAWTASNVTVTANDAVGPAGSSDADKIDDASAGQQGFVSQPVVIEDDKNVHFLAVNVKADTAAFASLQVKLTGGTTEITTYVELKFADATLIKGGAQAGQLHSWGRAALDSGYYQLWLAVRNNETGNTALTFELYPTGLASEAAADTGAIWAVDAFAQQMSPVKCRAVRQETDESKYSAPFAMALGVRMAAQLAFKRANSNTLATRLLRKYNDELPKWRSLDSREGTSPQVLQDSFVESRWAS